MAKKFPPERAAELLKPRFGTSVDPYALMAILPLQRYQHVGDIGCGPGYFAIPLGKYLYGGRLYAVDAQPGMLEYLKQEIAAARLSNIQPVAATDKSIPLDDCSLDGALCASVLHEIRGPLSFVKEIARLLKPKGWLAILEWAPADVDKPELGPPAKIRIPPDKVAELGAKANLKLTLQRSVNPARYLTLFTKP